MAALPEPPLPPAATEIVGMLAEEDRLRVAAALVLGAGTLAEVVEATGLPTRQAAAALDRLSRGGLVETDGEGRVRFAGERLKQAARTSSPRPDAGEVEADPVLRTFVRDGRMVSIPTARAKRLVVLEWLAARFEPGRVYPEAQVNRVLSEVHPDHAALRRYLVDEELMERRDGFYWRAGGAFEVD